MIEPAVTGGVERSCEDGRDRGDARFPQLQYHSGADGGARRRRPVTGNSGWCPVDPITFASKLQPDIHVISDAIVGGDVPNPPSANT
jgi:hypothetical protein